MPSKLDPARPLIEARLAEYAKLTATRLFKGSSGRGLHPRELQPGEAVQCSRAEGSRLVENPEFLRFSHNGGSGLLCDCGVDSWLFRIQSSRSAERFCRHARGGTYSWTAGSWRSAARMVQGA